MIHINRSKWIILTIACGVVIYVVLAGFNLWSIHQTGRTHNVKGRITKATLNEAVIWGMVAERSPGTLFLAPKFRFSELPIDQQVVGRRIQLNYRILDSLGGEWGVVIQPITIQ